MTSQNAEPSTPSAAPPVEQEDPNAGAAPVQPEAGPAAKPSSGSATNLVGISVIALLITCALWSAAYLGLLRERWKAEQLISSTLAQKESVLKQLQASLADQASFAAELTRLKSQIASIEQRLPANADISSLLESIANEANAAHLLLQEMEENPQVTTGDLGTIPLKLVLSGSFSEMMTFIRQLALLPRVIVIEDLSLSVFSREDRHVSLIISLNLNAYTSNTGGLMQNVSGT